MLHQAKNSEEKAKKAMVDAARLADELRAEQDHTTTQSKVNINPIRVCLIFYYFLCRERGVIILSSKTGPS